MDFPVRSAIFILNHKAVNSFKNARIPENWLEYLLVQFIKQKSVSLEEIAKMELNFRHFDELLRREIFNLRGCA